MNGIEECDSIYGVNVKAKITPVMVRDAIIECYYQADAEVLDSLFQYANFDSKDEEDDTKRYHIEITIKRFFDLVNGDYNNPTKESLINVIDKCKEFAKMFRDESIIESNYKKILILIDKLE